MTERIEGRGMGGLGLLVAAIPPLIALALHNPVERVQEQPKPAEVRQIYKSQGPMLPEYMPKTEKPIPYIGND